MTPLSAGRLIPSLFLALLLSGCITSAGPLVGIETAVAPFEPGTWQQETFNSDTKSWEPAENVLLVKRAGNAYSMTAPGEQNAVTVSFHPLAGTGSLLIALDGKNEEGVSGYFYAVAKSEADGIHVFDPECSQTLGDALASFRFEADRFVCTARDRAGIEAFLAGPGGDKLSAVGRFRRLGP